MPPDLFRAPPRLPLVAPSILSADFAHLAEDAADTLASGADLLHVDVMDGRFVPNLTLGPALVASLRRALPGAYLDVHLMVEAPERFVGPFADAGADHISFHIEVHAAAAAERLADRVRRLGPRAGIVLNPPTPAEPVLEVVGAFDCVVVMGVHPGFGGQGFLPEVLPKAERIKAALRPDQRLEIDGGCAPATAAAMRRAGFDVLVAGSAVFKHPRGARGPVIEAIRSGKSG